MCSSAHMKITKDKAFERLIKLEKGKASYQIAIINNRHVHGIKLSIQTITGSQCQLFNNVSSTMNMIQCNLCEEWYHWYIHLSS